MDIINLVMAANQRLAYTTKKHEVLMEEKTIPFFDGACEEVWDGTVPNVGDVIEVSVDNVIYKGALNEVKTDDAGGVYIGNPALIGLSGETQDNYAVALVKFGSDVALAIILADEADIAESEHRVQVVADISVVKKIDSVYLAPPIIEFTGEEKFISLELGAEIRQRALDGVTPCVMKASEDGLTAVAPAIHMLDTGPLMKLAFSNGSDNKQIINFEFLEDKVRVFG